MAQMSKAEAEGVYKDRVDLYRETGGRWGTPQEVAGIVGMLCSPESGYCTGQVVCANGGMIFNR